MQGRSRPSESMSTMRANWSRNLRLPSRLVRPGSKPQSNRLATEPLGQDKKGQPVFLRDIWPSTEEIATIQRKAVTNEMFAKRYVDVFKGDKHWQAIKVAGGKTYAWDMGSTYVQNPPYFEGMTMT